MRWQDMRRSENVEDRTAGGGGGFPVGGIPLGGGALLIIVVVSLLFGVNPLELLGVMSGGGPAVQQSAPPGYGTAPRGNDPQQEFVARVLGDTEDFWSKTFSAMNARYAPPRLVLYRGVTQSACGVARAAVGPFYCPGDREVYLDTDFFQELARRFGAPGEFAEAYVIAHEIGHHVQNLVGTMERFDQQAARLDRNGRNALSVRLELQADCYAGVWASSARQRGLIDTSDVESGLRAAAAVGDDMITKGRVPPDAFTHGTAAQRTHWFRAGLSSGDMRQCNTFAQGSP
jgi:predicted metalloprotease